jgi:DNA-directed RNA polymerase subunit RPC12/RpoP
MMSRRPNDDCPYCGSTDLIRAIFRTPALPRGMPCHQCRSCGSQFDEDEGQNRVTVELRAAGLIPLRTL